MRETIRRCVFLLLTAGLLLCTCGASLADAQQDAGVKMELPVSSFCELMRQVPDVPLMDAPKGAQDVAYSVVGDMPTIAQIKFVLHDRSFCYRAARFSNSSNMPDISGMKNKFDAQMELGGVLYRQDTSTGAGVASWYYESTHSQYSVAIQKGFDPEYMRQVAVAMRSQSGDPFLPEPVAPGVEMLGTVTSVSATTITVKDLKSHKYTFALDACTVFTSVVAKGSIVRVVYAAPYAENRLARRIELVETAGEPAPAPKEKNTVSRATKSGTILARGSERLQIERPSGSIYTFYTPGAAIYGDTWAGVGDSATVSYYVDSYGTKVATKITYRATYDPIPEPWPCADPCFSPVAEPYSCTVPVPIPPQPFLIP